MTFIRLSIFTTILPLLFTSSICAAQTPDLAEKKWVIEGVWRGYQALYRDSVVLVHRVIPRAHDYVEFFADSTFHFNYFDRPVGQGLEQYRKSLWSPGTWSLDTASNVLKLFFTDDRTTQVYKVQPQPDNTIIWYNQRPNHSK